MALSKLERQLQMIILLTQNKNYDVNALVEQLGMSWRSIYRYLEEFRNLGFVVECKHGIYRLDKSSPYFNKITELIHFTENEAMTLKKILESHSHPSPEINYLLRKLSRIYDFEVIPSQESDERFSKNYKALYSAIKEGRQVVLHNYSSAHSRTTSNRKVEPFALLAGNTEIRCFELESGMNKTFKISRIENVEVLDSVWEFSTLHRNVYTDAFHFSGTELIPIRLRLKRLACHLLREEYLVSSNEIEQESEETWIYSTHVCSYIGVGRFVMGLLNEIEIIEDAGLKDYIQKQIEIYNNK